MPKRSQENKGKERKRKGREEGNAVRIRVDGDEAEVGTNTAHSAHPSLLTPIRCSVQPPLCPVIIFGRTGGIWL